MITVNVHVLRSIAGGFFGNGVFRAKNLPELARGLDIYFAAEGRDWNEFQQNIKYVAKCYSDMTTSGLKYELNIMIEESNSGLLVSGNKHNMLIDWIDDNLVGRRPFDGSRAWELENSKVIYLPFSDCCMLLCVPMTEPYLLMPEYIQWMVGIVKRQITKLWPEEANRTIGQFIGSSE